MPISQKKKTREKIFFKLFVKDKTGVTPEKVKYFRNHSDEIDEITAPLNVHKMFLLFGASIGVLFVAFSKVLNFTSILYFLHGYLQEFFVDIIFEIGVALIGAGVTAYLLGILLNTQQQNAKKWRKEIRRQIHQTDMK